MIPTRSPPLIAILIVCILLAAGCTGNPDAGSHPELDTPGRTTPVPPVTATPWAIPSDKYVFIDRHVSRSGEAVSGTCGGGMMIDFPMYSFNRETGELGGMSAREFEVNDSLKIVLGDGVSLGGALGGGASTYLTPVYALPFEKGRVRITGVSSDGLAVMASGNETITLPAGETWTTTTSVTTREFTGGDGTCAVTITTKETIYNAGILAKSKIRSDG